ncbi:MAG TPA: RNA methyltransferase [Bacteroidales bacterium]|jgi:TrmH family RNA methyltransferase|nr:RNA methyltransferase [Bacteroidales bacterium]
MLSTNRIKFIRSLQQKKTRKELGLFIAEGPKLVKEILLSNLEVEWVYHTSTWVNKFMQKNVNSEQINPEEMNRISGLKTSTEVLAIVKRPESNYNLKNLKNSFFLALDGIQDPGNFGTIIRLAHWFGISTIICSNGTVDAYSPKVVQATMGAIVNVNIVYTDLVEAVKEINHQGIPLIGTFLNGENIYTKQLPSNGIVVMGNEGKGIRPEIESYITTRITIPNFALSNVGSESLNVSMATAIVCSELKRRSN